MLDEKFWSSVDTKYDCWTWRYSKDKDGYGKEKRNYRDIRAHRLSYEMHIGPIPKGMFVCHRCDNPSCVRPSHLFLGSAKDNSQDSVNKHRISHGERRPCSKLKSYQVLQIKEYLNSGCTLKELAKRYHVSTSTISLIKTNKSWRHV